MNNSGVGIGGWFVDQTEEQWDRVIDTNLKGAFLVTREVARWLQAAKQPDSIINVASIQGLRQASLVGPHAVSSADLVQLTKVMALELARHDIRVNVIAPGFIPVTATRDSCESPAGQQMLTRIPQRRFVQPQDLDGVLLLPVSDASLRVTGTVIAVDGVTSSASSDGSIRPVFRLAHARWTLGGCGLDSRRAGPVRVLAVRSQDETAG